VVTGATERVAPVPRGGSGATPAAGDAAPSKSARKRAAAEAHNRALTETKPVPSGRSELRDWENRRPVRKAKGRGNYIASRHARRAGEAQFRENLTHATKGMGLSRPDRLRLLLAIIEFGRAVNRALAGNPEDPSAEETAE